jgi:hypothetical protein
MCQDDGEMYDEFGVLKKKFRTKAKQGEAQVLMSTIFNGRYLARFWWICHCVPWVELHTQKKKVYT